MAMRKRPKPKFRQDNSSTTTAALETETIRVPQVVGENTEQTIVRGIITVPTAKPEPEEILSIDSIVKLKKINVIPNKVIFEATLRVEVMYSAFKKEQSVHTFHDKLDFTDFIEVEGARPGMDVELDFVVEDVSLTRNPRCDWDVAAVIQVTARVTEDREVNALTECPQGFQCETEKLNLKQVVGSASKQVLVDEAFELRKEFPGIEKCRKCICDVEIKHTKLLKNKVIIEGEVEMECAYTALKDDQSVHTFDHKLKFNDFVEVKGAEQGMEVDVDAIVESCEVDVGRDCKMEPTIVIQLKVRVLEERSVEVITDIEGADVETVNLQIEDLVAQECKQVIVKDAKEPPSQKPDIDKVKEVIASDVIIKDVDVIKDKVLIKGEIEFEILYTAMNKDQSMHMIHRKVPFKTFIDVPGARANDHADIDVEVEWANAKLNEHCELVIEAVLNVCARVTELMEQPVVVGFTPRPTTAPPTAAPEACVPGTIFNYTIVKGDTLSKLAQRYGTTVSAIMAINPEIQNPNMLTVGQTIKIPCEAKG